MAVYLVENGADVSIQAKDNSTAFEMAMIIGKSVFTGDQSPVEMATT